MKEDFQEPKTIDEILDHLNISKNEYERAFSISDEDSFQIVQNNHLTHALLVVTFQKANKHEMQT